MQKINFWLLEGKVGRDKLENWHGHIHTNVYEVK